MLFAEGKDNSLSFWSTFLYGDIEKNEGDVSTDDSEISLGPEFGGKAKSDSLDFDNIDAVIKVPGTFEDEPYLPEWPGCLHREIKHFRKGPTLWDYQFVRKPKSRVTKLLHRPVKPPWHYAVKFIFISITFVPEFIGYIFDVFLF